MSYQALLREHRRLTILLHLSEVGGHTSNASLLTDVCNGCGVGSTRDQVSTEIQWLAEQGLCTFTKTDDFVVATATTRGVEVAQGRVVVEGVKRPRPRP